MVLVLTSYILLGHSRMAMSAHRALLEGPLLTLAGMGHFFFLTFPLCLFPKVVLARLYSKADVFVPMAPKNSLGPFQASDSSTEAFGSSSLWLELFEGCNGFSTTTLVE